MNYEHLIALIASVLSTFGKLEHLILSLIIEEMIRDILKHLHNCSYEHDKSKTGLYPPKIPSTVHTSVVPWSFKFCDLARQKLVIIQNVR